MSTQTAGTSDSPDPESTSLPRRLRMLGRRLAGLFAKKTENGAQTAPGWLLRNCALASFPGLLLLLVLSWILAWLTYATFNVAFDWAIYGNLKHFSPLTADEKLECYARAVGFDIARLNPTRKEDEPKANESARKLLETFENKRYRVVSHDELQAVEPAAGFQKAIPKKTWHEIGRSGEVPVQGGTTFAIVWRADDAPTKPDGVRPAGQPPPAQPAPSAGDTAPAQPQDSTFLYVLEIRSVNRPYFQIRAHYFRVVNGEKQKPKVRDHFVVLDRPTYLLGMVQPCAVNHSASELAARFVDQMKIDTRGDTQLADKILKDRNEIQEVETFIEQVLLRRLGEERNEGGLAQDTPRLRTDRQFRSLEQITVWPRRLEGSDILGFIQFLTFVAFYATVLTFVAQWLVVLNQRTYLDNTEVFSKTDEPIDFRQVESRIKRLEELRDQYRDQQGRGDALACVPLEIAYSGYCGLKAAHMRPEGVPGFVETRANILLERTGSRQWLLRFLIWLIPSIGFIGTVVGIGAALLGTGEVLSSNQLQQQAAIQAIAGNLGTAFDTTFVALVLSIITMFLVNSIQKTEEELVLRSSERTLSTLIDPDQIPPPPSPTPADPSSPSIPMPRQVRVLRKRTLQPVRRRQWVDIMAVLLVAAMLLAGLTAYFRTFGPSSLADSNMSLGQELWQRCLDLFARR